MVEEAQERRRERDKDKRQKDQETEKGPWCGQRCDVDWNPLVFLAAAKSNSWP